MFLHHHQIRLQRDHTRISTNIFMRNYGVISARAQSGWDVDMVLACSSHCCHGWMVRLKHITRLKPKNKLRSSFFCVRCSVVSLNFEASIASHSLSEQKPFGISISLMGLLSVPCNQTSNDGLSEIKNGKYWWKLCCRGWKRFTIFSFEIHFQSFFTRFGFHGKEVERLWSGQTLATLHWSWHGVFPKRKLRSRVSRRHLPTNPHGALSATQSGG